MSQNYINASSLNPSPSYKILHFHEAVGDWVDSEGDLGVRLIGAGEGGYLGGGIGALDKARESGHHGIVGDQQVGDHSGVGVNAHHLVNMEDIAEGGSSVQTHPVVPSFFSF